MGPLGSNMTILRQPPRKTAAHSDDNPGKTEYLLLLIVYPIASKALCLSKS
jgi:hypothetical protein